MREEKRAQLTIALIPSILLAFLTSEAILQTIRILDFDNGLIIQIN